MAQHPTDKPGPIAVLLVDNSPLVGAALQRWFSCSSDLCWTGWLPNPDNIEDAIIKLGPGVVLLDWNMLGVDTAALLTRLVAAFPGVRFAVVSTHLNPTIIIAALKAGATGFLGKSLDPADFAAHVRLLAAGRVTLSKDALAVLLTEENKAA